jgi:hypothetical protein
MREYRFTRGKTKMTISINSKMSGFRKWAEAYPQNNGARTGAMDDRDIAAADPEEAGKTQDQQPHRPWLVPGIGKL